MKRLTLSLALCALSLTATKVAAAEDTSTFTNKVATLAKATELKTDQYYSLCKSTGTEFISMDEAGNVTAGTTPAFHWAEDYLGCLFTLETASDGSYYLHYATGDYLGELKNSTAVAGTAEKTAAYTLTADDSGAFTLQQGDCHLNASLQGTTSTSDATTWTLYAVTLNGMSDLSGSNLVKFQLNAMQREGGQLIRLKARLNSSYYLTSTESGVAKAATLTSTTEKSQIWVANYSSDGHYSLLNASTGEYLTSTFTVTGSETNLYIEQSPNDEENEGYFIISSASDFSGNTCLNYNNTDHNLYNWAYANDKGCDWAAEMVTEVSIDEVREGLMTSNEYAWELTDGNYYRIINYSYGGCMTESNNNVVCATANEANYRQYWKLTKSGQGWKFQNVMTDNYIGATSTTYSVYPTNTTGSVLYPRLTGDAWNPTWYIANSDGGTNPVLHCQSDWSVVPWNTSADASIWYFEEVELSEEDIEAAKGEYEGYLSLVGQLETIQANLDKLFSDKACTQLLSDIASLSDDELASNEAYAALPSEVQEMVLKVKNDSWAYPTSTSDVTTSYEKFFRIAPYRVYSNYSSMASAQGQSNYFGKLSGPTGIYLKTGEVLFLYVDSEPSNDCTLQAELVTTDGVPGSHTTGATTDLHQGLNLIYGTEDDVVYIFYQLDNTNKYLANYDDITIHIEGGTINGCFDVTRGMTNQDWANMKEAGLLNICPVINLKTDHLVFCMDADLVLSAMTTAKTRSGDSQEDAEKLMRIWNNIPAHEESFQGLEDFDGRFRNVWNCFSVDYNYMFATSYGTYYENSTLATVMNYYEMTHYSDNNNGGGMWGPSHEMGHNHQNLINLVGTTESSNNLFSNINMFDAGVSSTRGPSPQYNFDNYLATGATWLDRDIWITTRMFMQLYLYFHVMENDTTFLPNLFKLLRANPMSKSGTMSGSTDYLKFAQKVCDAANADLSEFFEAYGMFVPCDNYFVDDYSQYYVTTTQSEINTALKAMKKYEKKLGNIMFIDDHIVQHEADPDNIFECVPASNGLKVNCTTGQYYGFGQAGDAGDYEEFDGETAYQVDADYYELKGTTITFKGKDYVGHKVYDASGNLIWATNETSCTIPSAIASMFPDEVTVVAAEANMSDVPCPYYKSGSHPAYGMNVSFPDGVSKKWYTDTNVDAYLPTNAMAVITNATASDEVLASLNVISADSTAKSIVIDGDLECHIPISFTTESLSFTKSGNGFQALTLPFDVEGVSSIVNYDYVYDTTAAAGTPAIFKGDVALSLTDVSVTAGDYTTAESGNVLDAGGEYVVAATDVSPFTYLFDYAFEVGNFNSVEQVEADAEGSSDGAIYDLSGRRLSTVTRPGIYIVGGRKVMIK